MPFDRVDKDESIIYSDVKYWLFIVTNGWYFLMREFIVKANMKRTSRQEGMSTGVREEI